MMPITRSIAILVVVSLIVGDGAGMTVKKLELAEVYKHVRQGEWDYVFVPETEKLLIWTPIHPTITLLSWRERKTETFKLRWKDGRELNLNRKRRITQIDFIPHSKFVFLTLDDELLRADVEGWTVVESYGHAYVDVAKRGSFVVVSKPESRGTGASAVIVDTRDWKEVRRIHIPDRGLFLTPDDQSIAVGQFVWTEEAKRCTLSFFDIKSGAMTRSVDFLATANDCPGYNSFFHPTRPNVIVSGQRMKRVVFWDTISGQVLFAIEEATRLQQPAVSADGRWMYGSVRERDPRVLRDFKIWELETGAVVYESPEYPNRRNRSNNDPVLGSFSQDSTLLGVRSATLLTLYRLGPK